MTYQSSNNTVTIYINGVKCSTSQPKNLTGLSGTTALIGKRSSETYLFEGYLNDFRIYNTCLSPRQVKEISEGLCISIFILDWFEYKVLHDENKPYYVVFGHIFRPYGE